MSRKICFVAMGFGKKMDYRNSKEVDLDIIYKKVIKNLFETLYLIFDYPYKYYTFKLFEV